jgi:HrpA-like RNA helicase
VVDPGVSKQLNYDSTSESTSLVMTNISQACAKQRSGRAGRVQNGFCYRLYSSEKFKAMKKITKAEITRVSLTQISLKAKKFAEKSSIESFFLNAIQPPPALNIRQSVDLLKKIEALDHSENITTLGKHLASMPVDCQLGK